jgi:hypothetical protein
MILQQAEFSFLDAPNEIDGIHLNTLGKKNWFRLYNPVTKQISIPPPKKCKNCQTVMTWQSNGLIYKDSRNSKFYYQNKCHDGCKKKDNDEVNKFHTRLVITAAQLFPLVVAGLIREDSYTNTNYFQ